MGVREATQTKTNIMYEVLNTLAEAATTVAPAGIEGKLQFGLAALGAAFGIALIGMKATEATGRNPGAAGSILTLSIILAALIEGAFILTLLMGK